MRCYYDLLNVPRDVGAAELKKAYYKMSLEWHPDKNSSKSEDTTAVFQQIQEAYSVLSDPHERAWYDSHRAQILQSGGKKGCTNTEFHEERIDVFEYFTRSCYGSFDDSKNGFYTVYRNLFEKIVEEELRACENGAGTLSSSSVSSDDDDVEQEEGEDNSKGCHGLNGDTPLSKARRCKYPTFGFSDSNYADVVAPFYKYWDMFRTKKNYTWVEKYDVRCADSRQERRAMELENRKQREAARKIRNEEIRELVSHVKRRDKRVAAERTRLELVNQQAQARNQEISKANRQRVATELAEAWNEELASGGVAAQWAEDIETELARIEAELDGCGSVSSVTEQFIPRTSNNDLATSPDENDQIKETVDVDDFYCVACDKVFASINSKLSHESSKKHKKQAEILRKLLLSEEAAEEGQSSNEEQNDRTGTPCQTTTNVEVKLTKRAKKAQRKRLKEAEKVVLDCTLTDTNNLDTSLPNGNKSPSDDEMASLPPNIDEPNTTDMPTKSQSTLCETCGLDLLSRNKLFAHLKETGHAKLKPIAAQTKSRAGRKKR